MAIEIRETFQVEAPIDAVWRFVMDPQQVVTCMPGATLEEVVDERTFMGSVQIKVGAISARYRGRVRFTEVDPTAYSLQMVAEGRETGGGTARSTVSSRLRTLPGGQTEVVAEATVDLTGRIMQVGRGMIQGVSHQLFLQFVASTKRRLEMPAEDARRESAAIEPEPIRIVPVLLRSLWAAVLGFFRRMMQRRSA